MSWRLAECLVILRAEADAVAPNRDKTYDGTLGDAAHAARKSRHNPNAERVVCARDITHDPAHGMDVRSLFTFLCGHPHRDLAYIITNGQTASKAGGWKPKKYTGADMHLHHIHIAVGTGPDSNAGPPYDDLDSWGLAQWRGGDMTADEVRAIVREEMAKEEATTSSIEVIAATHNLDRLGILSATHDGGKVPELKLLRVALWRALKKAGVT